MPNPIRVEVLSRPGCHLCDEARAVIERVSDRYQLELRVINIETEPELEAAYGWEIPVVFIEGNKAFKYRVDEKELERKLKRLWNP